MDVVVVARRACASPPQRLVGPPFVLVVEKPLRRLSGPPLRVALRRGFQRYALRFALVIGVGAVAGRQRRARLGNLLAPPPSLLLPLLVALLLPLSVLSALLLPPALCVFSQSSCAGFSLVLRLRLVLWLAAGGWSCRAETARLSELAPRRVLPTRGSRYQGRWGETHLSDCVFYYSV